MATTLDPASPPRPKPPMRWRPDRLDRVLAVGALILLGFVVVALMRGFAEWGRVPALVWLHLTTILVALALTPTMLLRPRGDRLHRRLGWLWATAMFATAAISFGILESHAGRLSLIHILSAWTLLQVPLIVWSARNHHVATHRRAVRGMVIGALLVAGFFTFPFQRLLGHWLFG